MSLSCLLPVIEVVGFRELGAEGAIECWVSDNGAGIPEELLEKVFDKGESDPANEGGRVEWAWVSPS